MSKKIKVVMCPVDRAPYVTNISDSLENLQKIVGGYIETVGIATDCVMVCNEEGRLIGLPDNRSVSWLMPYSVQGDVFFCGAGDRNHCADAGSHFNSAVSVLITSEATEMSVLV